MKNRLPLVLTSLLIPMLSLANERGLDERINDWFSPISAWWEGVILHNFPGTGIPTIIFLLVLGAAFFTIYFGFINIRRFGLATKVVRGKFDELEGHSKTEKVNVNEVDGDIRDTIKDESQDGEVNHFQALATAVSGTVGNGNIAGVALAIALGGPGATFWMIICGLLGMSTKFVECTLGVRYRDVGEDGTVYGGPMYYLSKGLKERGFVGLGKVLAIVFAVFCVFASFGGGNAAQSNQAAMQIVDYFSMTGDSARTIVGLILMVLVGIIIIGGIKRIAQVTEKIVPFMAVMYIIACLYIIGMNFSYIDDAFALIIGQAFTPEAGLGGFLGVLIVGFRRAAFSNEAGAGSASIAHSAVKTKYPASEGLVALLEPFIDTVVICTMTALVIIMFNMGETSMMSEFSYGPIPNSVEQADGTFNVTVDGKLYEDVAGKVIIDGELAEGAGITQKAFAKYIPFFRGIPYDRGRSLRDLHHDLLVLLWIAILDVPLRKRKALRSDLQDHLLPVHRDRCCGRYEQRLGILRCHDPCTGVPEHDRIVPPFPICEGRTEQLLGRDQEKSLSFSPRFQLLGQKAEPFFEPHGVIPQFLASLVQHKAGSWWPFCRLAEILGSDGRHVACVQIEKGSDPFHQFQNTHDVLS